MLLRHRDEAGKNFYGTPHAVGPEPFHRKVAWREQAINFAQAALNQPRVTPELWRSSVLERATETFFFNARFLFEPKKDVRRTDQPVLVRSVQFQRAA